MDKLFAAYRLDNERKKMLVDMRVKEEEQEEKIEQLESVSIGIFSSSLIGI